MEALLALTQAIGLSEVGQLAQLFVLMMMLKALMTMTKTLGTIAAQTSELHRWHSREDDEHPGAKIWWGAGIKDLTETTEAIARGLQRIERKLERAHPEIASD